MSRRKQTAFGREIKIVATIVGLIAVAAVIFGSKGHHDHQQPSPPKHSAGLSQPVVTVINPTPDTGTITIVHASS